MQQRLMYLVGRANELTGPFSLMNGKVIGQIPNYTEIFPEPRKTIAGDEMCLAIVLPAEKVEQCQETREGEPIYRAWEGPKGSRQFGSYKVQVEIYPLCSPIDDQIDGMLEKISELNAQAKAMQVESEKLQCAKVEADQRVMQLEAGRNQDAQRLKVLEAQQAKLRDELMQARSGTVVREVTVKTLAQVLQAASDEVVKELPYIAGENLKHVRAWADEQNPEGAEGDEG